MDQATFQATQDELREMIAERLGVRAKTFARAVRKAGRLLPAPARAAAAELVALEARLANPKLAARTDPGAIAQAQATIRTALDRHRPGARRAWNRSLLLSEIGFKIAVVIVIALILVQVFGPG